MPTRVKLLYFKPATARARIWPLGIALRWSLGLIPAPQFLTMGYTEYQMSDLSELSFWIFAIRVALSGEAIIVTKDGLWDPAGKVDSDGVHAFGSYFELP
ncbi:hypothetical protein ACOTH5_31540 [Achromobacter xylosoxidans]|uniref:hypothetical protein n=1 Tax=Alcaligenes xylosoxydans xylosoxydans TaxID=85698 RepID=UPI00047A6030|nr:hypothetical protein [Achromobacter xylosoxidans]QQE59143.1 hypothetical protein I6H41_09155 [Achromobacter xylosoxidans]QQV12887.1 hypothetical protein I6I48_24275 [Achromobacter xylosoxidans]